MSEQNPPESGTQEEIRLRAAMMASVVASVLVSAGTVPAY